MEVGGELANLAASDETNCFSNWWALGLLCPKKELKLVVLCLCLILTVLTHSLLSF